MNIKSIMPRVTDLLLTALYYILAWVAGMAYINKWLGLW